MAVVIPYTKQTWTDGVSSCSAARNNVHEDGINDAHYQPSVRAYNNANQLLLSGSLTALAFNSERFDTAGNSASTMHDNVTNNSRLTCRYAGKYLVSVNVRWTANATGIRYIDVLLNGTTPIAVNQVGAISANEVIQSISCLYDLAVNDYLQCRGLQTSGGALNVEAIGNYSPEFSMVRVG